MGNFTETYNYYFRELGDKRVYNWWLFKGPEGTIVIIILYLYTVCRWIPRYMENRKPYKLKAIIQAYNIFQIVACTVIFHGLITSGWTTHYSWLCEPPDYSQDPLAIKALHMFWWTYLLKMTELIETAFFALRKKQSQITTLHLYHHSAILMQGWISAKYVAGGSPSFSIIINCFVHTLMYTYYFVSALGPNMQERLKFIKPKLTLIQMTQFWIVIAHSLLLLREECKIPHFVIYIHAANVFVIFAFFLNFYIKSYKRKRDDTVKQK